MPHHPVRDALDAAASGYPPSSGDLDQLGLSPAQKSTVRAVCAQASKLRADGFNGQARELARETYAGLAPDLVHPDESRPDPTDDLRPDELAALLYR